MADASDVKKVDRALQPVGNMLRQVDNFQSRGAKAIDELKAYRKIARSDAEFLDRVIAEIDTLIKKSKEVDKDLQKVIDEYNKLQARGDLATFKTRITTYRVSAGELARYAEKYGKTYGLVVKKVGGDRAIIDDLPSCRALKNYAETYLSLHQELVAGLKKI